MISITATSIAVIDDFVLLPTKIQRQLRRADDFIKLSVIAVAKVLSTGKQDSISAPDAALFLGSCFGPMQCNFEVIESLSEDDLVSPYLFSHSIFSAAAGYISRIFQIKGGALTSTSFGSPLFSCMKNAYEYLKSGASQYALVLQVESYSILLQDMKKKVKTDCHPWPAGAVAFLLVSNGEYSSGEGLKEIICDYRPVNYIDYLVRRESVTLDGSREELHDPLGAARFLNRVISEERKTPKKLTFNASWGSASINLV